MNRRSLLKLAALPVLAPGAFGGESALGDSGLAEEFRAAIENYHAAFAALCRTARHDGGSRQEIDDATDRLLESKERLMALVLRAHGAQPDEGFGHLTSSVVVDGETLIAVSDCGRKLDVVEMGDVRTVGLTGEADRMR